MVVGDYIDQFMLHQLVSEKVNSQLLVHAIGIVDQYEHNLIS
jgi:hypothetical protein